MRKSGNPLFLLAVFILLGVFGFSFTIPDNTNGYKLLSRYTLLSPSVTSAPVRSTNTITKQVLAATDTTIYKVAKVIDGDTIELENGQKVRYIGVDTPETVDPRRPVMCFGKEASEFNKSLVLGKDVRLVKDVSETDKYGRLLRYVYVSSGSAQEKETMINEVLVRQGYGHSVSYPPDIAFQKLFKEAENEAREHNRGLWENCN